MSARVLATTVGVDLARSRTADEAAPATLAAATTRSLALEARAPPNGRRERDRFFSCLFVGLASGRRSAPSGLRGAPSGRHSAPRAAGYQAYTWRQHNFWRFR
jgi:hypothetical protein